MLTMDNTNGYEQVELDELNDRVAERMRDYLPLPLDDVKETTREVERQVLAAYDDGR